MEARDADEGVNSELSYGLATGEPSVFSVNKATGEIYLNQVLSNDVDETLSVTVTVSDNGRPALTSTATLHFLIIAGSPPSDRTVYQPGSGDEVHAQWDLSVVIIVVLAGSCTLLLLAIILIATTCNRRKRDKSGEDSDSYGEKGTLERGRNHVADNPLLPLHGAGGGAGFEGHSYSSQPGGFTSAHPGGSDMCSASEDGSEVPCVYDSDSNSKLRGNKHEVRCTFGTLCSGGEGWHTTKSNLQCVHPADTNLCFLSLLSSCRDTPLCLATGTAKRL